MLDIENSIITLDAMGCQHDIAQQVVQQKADYILALKDNHSGMQAELAAWWHKSVREGYQLMFIQSIQKPIQGMGALKRGHVSNRLLSNKHIVNEQLPIYRAIYTQYANASSRPIILIDWSDLDTHKGCFLLRASVAFKGRGVAIYQEIHGASSKEKRCTQKAFLAKLNRIIDKDTKPIIVTDAGYKTTWFREVIELGWDFAGRVRKPMMYVNQQEDWEHTSELYKKATGQPIGFASHICRSQPFAGTLGVFKGKKNGRHSLTRHNIPRQSKCSKVHAIGATDP
jgi:hypothetical protein